MLNISWNEIHSSLDTNTKFNLFYLKLEKLLDEHFPTHKLTQREISLKSKPWITKQIQYLMKERDRLYKICCKLKSSDAKHEAQKNFKNARNLVTYKIKESKK